MKIMYTCYSIPNLHLQQGLYLFLLYFNYFAAMFHLYPLAYLHMALFDFQNETHDL